MCGAGASAQPCGWGCKESAGGPTSQFCFQLFLVLDLGRWERGKLLTVCPTDAFSFCGGCRNGGGVCDQGPGGGWLCSLRAVSRQGWCVSSCDTVFCGRVLWSCTPYGHGYVTAEAAESSFQLPPSLFSSCEGKSITAGLLWHHNPVDLFLWPSPGCGLEPAAALSNVIVVIKPKCYTATSLLTENQSPHPLERTRDSIARAQVLPKELDFSDASSFHSEFVLCSINLSPKSSVWAGSVPALPPL